MASVETAFIEGINNLVSSILGPISLWLKTEKKIDVSVEDLHDALLLPMPARIPTMNSTPLVMPNIPNNPTSNLNASAPSKAKAAKSRTLGPKEGPKCTYKFQRGKPGVKDQICTSTCMQDLNGVTLPVCKSCSTKKDGKDAINKFYNENGLTPALPPLTGKAAKAARAAMENAAVSGNSSASNSVSQPSQPEEYVIDGEPISFPPDYPNNEGYVVVIPQNIVIHPNEDGDGGYTAFCMYDISIKPAPYRALTASEEEGSKGMKFTVNTDHFSVFMERIGYPIQKTAKTTSKSS